MADHSVARDLLTDLARTAVDAARPDLAPFLPPPPSGRTVVAGAGKAAAAMAQSLEAAWEAPLSGLVVTRYGHALPCQHIEVVEAGHPVPDDAGREAAARMLELATTLGADDLLICLMSGGASALLPLPAGQITLAEKQTLTQALLRSGAAIDEINCVRRHISRIKGGRLAAAAAPARVVTLAISDVPNDTPLDIGSGPTVADHTTSEEALGILQRHAIPIAPSISAVLSANVPVAAPEHAEFHLVATPMQALRAAADRARAFGLTPLILGDALEGEARESGRVHAGIALSCLRHGTPLCGDGLVLLSGGEHTVAMRGNGRGGPNTEFLLGLAQGLAGAAGISAVAIDTDGADGSENNAGAFVFPDTLRRAAAQGLDVSASLAQNDAFSLFEKLGDLMMTGPTHTNVNDFRALLIASDGWLRDFRAR
jgi:hydroxypyruvate reductase